MLGLGAAKCLYAATNFNAGGFLPGFDVTLGHARRSGAGIALVLMARRAASSRRCSAAGSRSMTALRNVE